MENSYEKFLKKRKLIEKMFMVIILLLFLAFLVLWLKVESMIPRYIVGAILLISALFYKIAEKKMNEKEEELRPKSEDNDDNAT